MADNTQLDINQQINKLLSDRVALMRNQEASLNSQVMLATALCNALECGSLDDLENKLNGVREALQGAADDSDGFGDDITAGAGRAEEKTLSLAEAIRKLKDDFVKLNPVMAGIAAGAGTGFVRGIGSAWQSIKNITVGIFGLIKTLGKLAISILAIPFKIWEGIFGLAQGGGGGPPPILVELENIRKEFGSLTSNEGAALKGSLKEIRGEWGNLAKSGLSGRKIFGPAYEGMAKMLAENAELAKNLGAAFNSMMEDIDDSGNALMVYRKGMGLTFEQQAAMMKIAKFSGKSTLDTMRQFASMSIRMGAQFGVSAKVISRSMAEMATNTAHFGGLGHKVLGSIATYAHKLGIEIKDLAGVMDTFDDFESGAVAASKLAQSLNMNINSLDMLDTDDAAQRVEYLRQRFRESGHTYEELTRQQKKYLQSTAGIPDMAAAAAFGQGNLNKTYKEFQTASEKAEKKAMSQEEAMVKLAKAIERVFPSGGGSKFTSFFDAFTSGIASGIMRTWEFRRAMRALRHSIREVFWAGRRVGRIFVKEFPGVAKMLEGFRDVFHPRKFRKMMDGVVSAFRDLFKTLKTDPKAGINNFLKSFKEILKNFFIRSGPGGTALIEGGKEFLNALKGIFSVVFPMVLDQLARGANLLTDFLTKPPDLMSPIRKAFDGLVTAVTPLFELIGQKLAVPFMNLFKAMWKVAKPHVQTYINWMIGIGLAKIFLNVVAGAFMGAIGGAASKIGAVAITKLLTHFKLIKIPDVTPPGTGTPPVVDPSNPAGAAAAAAKLPIGQILGLVAGLIVLAGITIGLMRAFNVTPEEVMSVSVLIGSLSLSVAAMLAASAMVPPGSEEVIGKAMGTIARVMVAVGVLATFIVAMLSVIESIDIDVVLAFMGVVTSLTLATLPLIAGAFVIGTMSEAIAGVATQGMMVLGAFMVVLGIAGVLMVKSLASIKIDNPAGLAAIMSGLAEVFLAVVPLIGVAALMGYLMTQGPWGMIGVAVIVLGLVAVAGIVYAFIDSMIPAIQKLAAIPVPNVEGFKAVVEALRVISEAASELIRSAALLALSLAPSSGFSPEEFRKNADKMKEVVVTIITSGIGDIINKLIEFAKTTNVSEGTAAAISAIGSTLSGAAALATAFGPSEAAGKAIVEISTSFFASQITAKRMMDHVKATMPMMRQAMVEVIPLIGTAVSDIINAISGASIPADAQNIGPIITSMSSLFTAAATVMNAMSPSNEAWKALSEVATSFWEGGSYRTVLKEFRAEKKNRTEGMKTLLNNLRDSIIDIITGIKEPLREIASAMSGVSVENLKVTIPMISSVLEFSSDLIGNIGPAITAASKVSECAPAPEKATKFKSAIDAIISAMKEIGPSFQTLVEPMRSMIQGVLDIARGIKDTRGLKAKIDVVTAALQAVGAMISVFKVGGDLSSVKENGTIDSTFIQTIVESMNTVTRELLVTGGPLWEMSRALERLELGNVKKIKNVSSAIKTISEGLGGISQAFTGDGGISTFALTNFNGESGTLMSGLQSNVNLLLSGDGKNIFENMRRVVEQVPEGVSNRAESVRNMIATISSLSTAMNESGITSGDISAFVQLNNALAGHKTLKVEHKGMEIHMNVHVQMSAEQIAKGIIKVNDVLPNIQGNQKIATTP